MDRANILITQCIKYVTSDIIFLHQLFGSTHICKLNDEVSALSI